MSNDLLNGIKTYTTGEPLPAEDVNTANEHIVRSGFKSIIAGETIAKGEAVCVLASDGKAYKTDADHATGDYAVLLGFALEAGTAGNLIDIQCKGVFENLSGLTIGGTYYLSGTAGAITTTPNATRNVEVGIALSATHLLITGRRKKYSQGQTTRAHASGTGTQIIAHGLGVVPKLIKITAVSLSTSNPATTSSFGTATGTGDETCTFHVSFSGGGTPGQSSDKIIHTETSAGAAGWEAEISAVDKDNITLNFTSANGGGTVYIQWEAYA